MSEQFRHAVNLANQGQKSESIAIYEGLIHDYPDQPEFYNNLAVLYADQGQYEAASNTLLRAFNKHVVWGKLFDNLKAVHSKIASGAYSRALGTKENNHALKLASIESVILSDETRPAKQEAAVAVTTAVPDNVLPVTKTDTSPGQLSIEFEEKASIPTDTQMVSDEDRTAVITTLENWASAWSEQDIDRYLASYSPKFKPSGGMSLARWKVQRHERLAKPKSIKIHLNSIGMRIDNNIARVSLRQTYKSDTYKDSVTKRFILHRGSKGWLIVREEVSGP